IAGALETFQEFEFSGVRQDAYLSVIVVKMTDQHQIGRDALPAINVNRMRIENDARALRRGQIEERLAVPTEHRFSRVGGERVDWRKHREEEDISHDPVHYLNEEIAASVRAPYPALAVQRRLPSHHKRLVRQPQFRSRPWQMAPSHDHALVSPTASGGRATRGR